MCDCIDETNALLRPSNGYLVTAFVMKPVLHRRIILDVDRLESRGPKPRALTASFCPLCGEAYPKVGVVPDPAEPPEAAVAPGV